MSATADPRECPYVGLDPFESVHAEYFFGRRRESKMIADHVLARPVTVLYGPSGVGKSSILNVGLPAALKQIAASEHEEANARESDIAPSVSDRPDSELTVRRLREWQDPNKAEQQITAWAAETISGPVLLIFDQFEEYFLYRERMSDLDRALGNLLARRDRSVHLLFGVRDDALHRLDRLRAFVPGILETTIELRGLSDSGIEDAIRGPIERYNENYRKQQPPITVEDGLVATLVRQLKEADTASAKGRVRPGADGRVELPYLQLALTKLWKADGGAAAAALRESTLIHRLGGVRQIVRDHVNGVMGNLSAAEQALCAKMFDRLVTPIGGKIAYPTAALAVPEVVGPRVSEQAVETVLNKLTGKEQRILKPVMTSGGEGFELFHDVLGLPVLEWKRNFEVKKNQASVARLRRLAYGLSALIVAGVVGWINQSHIQSYIATQWRWWTVTHPYMLSQVRPYVLSAANEQALKPGDSFKECAQDCPQMVVVPAGSFLMGAPATESQAMRYGYEVPQHTVTIAKPFAVSKFELTFAEWDACVAAGGCTGHNPDDEGWGRGQQPAINLSWDDAQQYVTWFAEMTGKPYRLLSESEYEYAARAGTTTAYPWGPNITLNGAAMANCSGCGSRWDNRQPAPVGSFPPNKFGLYDMVGNVVEWTEDCAHFSYANGAPTDGSAWIADGDCDNRVVRGGSWNDFPANLRSADRYWDSTVVFSHYWGFRVARTLSAP